MTPPPAIIIKKNGTPSRNQAPNTLSEGLAGFQGQPALGPRRARREAPRRVFFLFALLLCSLPVLAKGDLNTGFFLSLGHMHYSYKAFGEGDAFILSGEPSDLFFGLSLDYKSQWELNLVYNRATEDYSSDPNTVTFDKDGIGLEVGKIIPIPLVHKSHFDLSVEFVGGGYGMIYPYKKVGSGLNSVNLETANAMDDLFYHVGFYWGIRLKYLISQKVGLYIGYKSIIPVRSNEFEITRGKEILITKSFLTIGVSF